MNTSQSISDSQVIVNGKGLIGLLELVEFQYKWIDDLRELGVQVDHGYGSPDPLEIVFDLLGFPEDSVEEDGFCRDWLRDGPGEFGSPRPNPREYLDWLFEQKKVVFPD